MPLRDDPRPAVAHERLELVVHLERIAVVVGGDLVHVVVEQAVAEQKARARRERDVDAGRQVAQVPHGLGSQLVERVSVGEVAQDALQDPAVVIAANDGDLA
jgi:hypothetical protein